MAAVIEKHADKGKSGEYNPAPGDRRAGAVKSFLIRQGIERKRLIVEWVAVKNDRWETASPMRPGPETGA
jgi:outer membrane protein OmpA-like peptidoglycan-associated protein